MAILRSPVPTSSGRLDCLRRSSGGRPGLPSAIPMPSILPKEPCSDYVGTVLFSRSPAKASFLRFRKNKTRSYRCGLLLCRDDWIRTSDPLHPMQVRYRAALRPVNPLSEGRENTPKRRNPLTNPFNFFFTGGSQIFGAILALSLYLL
jgi:hypothetical protein